MGLGGIFPLAMPYVNKTLAMSQLMPLSPWIVLRWLTIIGASGMLVGVFIFYYEVCAQKEVTGHGQYSPEMEVK